jgi:hypothetical protein
MARLVINGVDFDTLFEQAMVRIRISILRHCAAALAIGRPKPGRSAGQLWRQMKVREGLPITPHKRRERRDRLERSAGPSPS